MTIISISIAIGYSNYEVDVKHILDAKIEDGYRFNKIRV